MGNPPFEDVSPIKDRAFPASYVSLPEGKRWLKLSRILTQQTLPPKGHENTGDFTGAVGHSNLVSCLPRAGWGSCKLSTIPFNIHICMYVSIIIPKCIYVCIYIYVYIYTYDCLKIHMIYAIRHPWRSRTIPELAFFVSWVTTKIIVLLSWLKSVPSMGLKNHPTNDPDPILTIKHPLQRLSLWLYLHPPISTWAVFKTFLTFHSAGWLRIPIVGYICNDPAKHFIIFNCSSRHMVNSFLEKVGFQITSLRSSMRGTTFLGPIHPGKLTAGT